MATIFSALWVGFIVTVVVFITEILLWAAWDELEMVTHGRPKLEKAAQVLLIIFMCIIFIGYVTVVGYGVVTFLSKINLPK